MTWSTDPIAHGNQQNKKAHSFRKSIMSYRPSKRHHIVLRKKSKCRTLEFPQRSYTRHSSSSFTVDGSTSEDENKETGTDQGSFERNCCRQTTFKSKTKKLSSPCGSGSGPKIIHHQVGRSSKTSATLPSCKNFTEPSHIQSANAEDEDDGIGTNKCCLVRNSWGRTPVKKRILSSPCHTEFGPNIMHHHVGWSSDTTSETLPSCEDPSHIHLANFEDEDGETETNKCSLMRSSWGRTPVKNKKSSCRTGFDPKIMHHQVDRSSETSETLPSCKDFTDPSHIRSANAEDDAEEMGTDKCSLVGNSWGRTPVKNKLSSPCRTELGPEITPHQVDRSSETSEISKDFTDSAHSPSANANLELDVDQENLNSISIGGCVDDDTETGLLSEATITDLCHNLYSKCVDGYSAVGSETCVLEEDTRKTTAATVSNLTVHEALGTGPEACILEEEKCTSISPIQGQESLSSERHSKEVITRCRRYLERRCSTMHCRKINSCNKLIEFAVSGSLDTGVEQPSFSDIYVNMDVSAARPRSRGTSSGECDTLPQNTTILDISKSRKATTGSYNDTSRSAEVSSASGNTDISHSHLGPANNTNQPLHRRQHRERPIRACICRRPRKILVLGDMMSGKSNLISAYCSDKYKEDYIPTIVRCLQTDADVLGESINLVVVEISGRDDFQPLRRYAYHKMDAAIICYPVDSDDSLERVRNYWIPELRKHAPKAPFVVVGTKRDIRDEARDRVEEHKQKLRGKGEEVELAGRLSAEAEFVKKFVSHDRGKRVSNDLGAAAFYECCSVYRDGTRKVFEGVAKIALQKSRRKRKMSSRHVDSMCTII